jgi:hypothetical protein
MNVRDIPRTLWPAFLDYFSRMHRAQLATVGVGATADGESAVAHPLRSVTPFVYNDRVAHIDIRFQDDVPSTQPLRITGPGAVRVDESTEGIARGLEIVDSHGISTRLQFKKSPGTRRRRSTDSAR